MTKQMSELSGGQLQRVLLAKALLGSPEMLLLDEATQGLDQPGAAEFYKQIEKLREETGCAILMISHDLHVVMSASDRVICLNGHICCSGTPQAVAATSTAMWVYRIGAERAKRVLFTGDQISGVEAASMGLVLKSLPEQKLNDEVEAQKYKALRQ